ncbi:hypothetical protein [Prosthecobacter sp.]|uniref:hypothetical protein n=1 Tax=Prosthecobacter sp. TaxID=1965333 RepID=UPI002AB81351|nr:hypothetical protein [Prosthecobacter sp.]MDZ4401062.1 hypothetical protein [Prosthecobacter sp.]
MKSLFYTILIIGAAFLGYDYFLAPPGQKMVFKSLNPPKQAKVVPVKPVEEKKPVTIETAPAPVKPVVVETPKPVAPTPASASVAVSAGPRFDPIEVLTGNWQKIPPSAFAPPREVQLLQEAEFKMSVGASKVAAGGIAFAISADNGVITLAPTATSPARAQLPIDSTDLKMRLNEVYEKWKIVRAAELKAIAAKKQMSSAQHVSAAPSSSEADASGKPVRDSSGAYPLLVASMKRGQVTEITPENITGWQEPQPTTIQGKGGWAVKVNFNAKTVFGPQPAEAQALVLNGKVTGWYFTGSGEEVP